MNQYSGKKLDKSSQISKIIKVLKKKRGELVDVRF